MVSKRNEFDDYEFGYIDKKASSMLCDSKTTKSVELFERIRKINSLPQNVFKMQTLDEFMGIHATICGIIYIIKEESYSMDVENNKELKLLCSNLNIARDYYKSRNYLEYAKVIELKKLGEKAYYEYEKPNRPLVIDWIIAKIEDNFRDVRYY